MSHSALINPATVAHIAATLAIQSENLRSDSDIIDTGLKPNRYRENRIRELVELAWDFMEEASRLKSQKVSESCRDQATKYFK